MSKTGYNSKSRMDQHYALMPFSFLSITVGDTDITLVKIINNGTRHRGD